MRGNIHKKGKKTNRGAPAPRECVAAEYQPIII
jgi:hypothetical protein